MGSLGGKIMGVVTALTALYVGAKKVADWVDQEQSKQIRAVSKAKVTESSMVEAMKGGETSRIGYLKGEMYGTEAKAGLTVMTPDGKINDAELWRRARDLLPDDPLGAGPDYQPVRAALVKKWKAKLQDVIAATDMKKVSASHERDIKSMSPTPTGAPVEAAQVATAPSTPSVAPPPTAVAPRTAAQPQIVLKESGSTDSILTQILETLKRGLGPGVGTAKAAPGKAALNAALGG